MLKYEYKEYENYIRNNYTTDQFIEMWNDADIGYTIGREKNLWFVIEDGVKDYFDTSKEFFSCINIYELKEYEEENGWMY